MQKALILMDDPPSLDPGELTDKGSVNQRAVLSFPRRHGRGALCRTTVRPSYHVKGSSESPEDWHCERNGDRPHRVYGCM